MIYRMHVRAALCFDVVANSKEEAIDQARTVCVDMVDGADVASDEDRGMRVYPTDEVADIVDQYEVPDA